jgi:hypothetical protein
MRVQDTTFVLDTWRGIVEHLIGGECQIGQRNNGWSPSRLSRCEIEDKQFKNFTIRWHFILRSRACDFMSAVFSSMFFNPVYCDIFTLFILSSTVFYLGK